MLSTFTGQAKAVGAVAAENALEEHCGLQPGMDTAKNAMINSIQARLLILDIGVEEFLKIALV